MTRVREDIPKQTARDRRAVIEEAGLPRLSFVSVLAGTLAAYGAFAIVAALAAAILDAADVDTDFSTNDWTSTGAVGGLATGIALLLAYLFGGYIAGRMARRDGLLHGVAVAVLSIVGGGIAGALIGWIADDRTIEDNLGSIGVPTNWDEWGAVTWATAIVAIAAIVIGAIAGALYGERWHARLVQRAADPSFGPAAEARRRAEEQARQRDSLVERESWPGGVRDEREERVAGGERTAERDLDGEREPERAVRSGEPDRLARGSEEIDLREREPSAANAEGEPREEPRYTAEEWQAIQAQQAARARAGQRF